MAVAAGLFLAISAPIVIRGAPLADDFHNCLEPVRVGLASFVADSAERLGAIRPARFLEIFLTTGVCQSLPFGFAIVVPLALTFLVAWLLRGLLRDLGTPSPWPEVAAAVWLLQPLGTESSLWPAALHVPLGLALALAALRLHRAGRHWWGALAVAGASLSVEQAVLALPLGAWLTPSPERRRQALVGTVVPVFLVLLSFALWRGVDVRLQASLTDRVTGLLNDPGFYLKFPAVGLGVHSIPLAVVWAFPISILFLVAGALVGARLGRNILRSEGVTDSRWLRRVLLAGLGLVVLVNIPVVMAIPRGGSPRLFTPTWLVLSGLVGMVGSRVVFRKQTVAGAICGVLATGAVLSLILSVNVRLRSVTFAETAFPKLATEVPQGGVIAVCGIRRTVVEPAPRGAFALHELVYEWSAADALEYYTGRQATFLLAGELWNRPCPTRGAVDRLVRFSALQRTAV